MYRGPLIFGVIILILIVGVITLFGGHHKSSNPSTPTTPVKSLPDYASTNATVVMTIDGAVNGDDAHRAIRLTIGRDQRDLDIIQGYSGHVIEHHKTYNTQNAYAVFLRAIDYGGFLTPIKKPKVPNDERGLCPQGFRFIFELKQNGKDLSRLWASTCGATIGTSGSNSQLMQDLFEAQLSNYDTLTQNIDLGA